MLTVTIWQRCSPHCQKADMKTKTVSIKHSIGHPQQCAELTLRIKSLLESRRRKPSLTSTRTFCRNAKASATAPSSPIWCRDRDMCFNGVVQGEPPRAVSSATPVSPSATAVVTASGSTASTATASSHSLCWFDSIIWNVVGERSVGTCCACLAAPEGEGTSDALTSAQEWRMWEENLEPFR